MLQAKDRSFGPTLGDRAIGAAVPVATVLLLLAVWELAVRPLGIPAYMLPLPSDFLALFWTKGALILRHTLPTAGIILGGFALGTLVAVPLGLAIASSRFLQKGLYPVLVILQIAPKTIIAPLLIVWYGTGSLPKLMLTTLMTFFPILVDSMAGFRAIDPRLYQITASMGASSRQTFRAIRVPAAMPFIFSGLKIGMVSAVMASMVVEYIGSSEGLGYLTMYAFGRLDVSLMFAAILTTAVLGLVFTSVLVSTERVLMPWLRRAGED